MTRVGRMKRREVRDGDVFYYVERNGDPVLGAGCYRSGPPLQGQPARFGPIRVEEALPTDECTTCDLDVLVVWSPEESAARKG